ncbi:hypothetical protein CBM2599_A150120 [Cupriavidus taiwanensis]|nr:hypothetical protein CBM2599_A150120 [Cupriavidus taiwanensis]SOY84647.1 hypothetical protein CBM2600_A140119 [Cupriavidus taiwanensis]
MIVEAGAVQPRIAVEVLQRAHLGPGGIDAQGDDGQQRIDDPDSEIFRARPGEAQAQRPQRGGARAGGRCRFGRVGGQGEIAAASLHGMTSRVMCDGYRKPAGISAAAGACFKNATMPGKAIAATASHSDTDKYRRRHNLYGRVPPAHAVSSSPWKTLVTLWKHSVTLISSCNKLRFGAIHKIKGLARLARKSLISLLQDERRATAANGSARGEYGSSGRELR